MDPSWSFDSFFGPDSASLWMWAIGTVITVAGLIWMGIPAYIQALASVVQTKAMMKANMREEAPPPLLGVPSPAALPSPTTSPGQPPAPSTSAPRTAPTPTEHKTTPPPRWSPIRVLHLSDLHFSATTPWDPGTVLGCLAADVVKLRAEIGEIDLIVLTGDIANFGTADEYAQATAWLTGPLATAAGVTPAQIRVVPGNHDVHRGSITRTANVLAKGLLSEDDPQQAIAEVLSSESERAPLLARQSAYLTFAQTFHPGLTVPWWSERPEIPVSYTHLTLPTSDLV